MEITSFPGFDRSITDDDIKNFQIQAKIYRNRRIGDFLKELHLIEGRNTGFPNALNALKKNGSKPLQFKMNLERDYLSVIIPIHEVFLSGKKQKQENYENKIIDVLPKSEKQGKNLTQISKELNYKGISKKLRDTVYELARTEKISRVVSENEIKYFAKIDDV